MFGANMYGGELRTQLYYSRVETVRSSDLDNLCLRIGVVDGHHPYRLGHQPAHPDQEGPRQASRCRDRGRDRTRLTRRLASTSDSLSSSEIVSPRWFHLFHGSIASAIAVSDADGNIDIRTSAQSLDSTAKQPGGLVTLASRR
jgi:hypothetical protein